MNQQDPQTTQTHILSLGVAHLNLYPIYDLLEYVKKLVLQNDHRTPMIKGNSRISKRNFGENPVMIVCQRLEPDERLIAMNALWVELIEQ